MSNKMWGGRFTERPDAIMEEIYQERKRDTRQELFE